MDTKDTLTDVESTFSQFTYFSLFKLYCLLQDARFYGIVLIEIIE